MAPFRTPSQSARASPRSTRSSRRGGLASLDDAAEVTHAQKHKAVVEPEANGHVSASETPSRRKRPAAKAAVTPQDKRSANHATTPTTRKRKVDNILDFPESDHMAPSDTIVVDSETRSSGRVRKKTAKLSEMEIQTSRKNTARVSARISPRNEASNDIEQAEPGVPKVSSPKVVVTASDQHEVGERVELEAEQVPPSTPKSTPGRKRGRPKGSKNKRSSVNAAGDPPFEDISIHQGAKPRKQSRTPATIVPVQEPPPLELNVEQYIQAPNGLDSSVNDTEIPISSLPIEESFPARDELMKLLAKPIQAKNFNILRQEIILRLSGKVLTPLVGMDHEYDQVRSLLQQTVAAGEGNSMLIIGNRGSGKTTLVETALAELAKAHAEEFHVIRLNGFVHTDDKLALREIWRQLGKEMQLGEGEQTAHTNYADTLASLLAVLSHPAELSRDVDPQQTSTSVVFVLDEFDLFATHPRQALLYNLFDIAQARKAPIAVLGLTTKIDVLESLEKRVKSRFSHRYVHLAPPRSYSTFLAILHSALHCTPGADFAPPASAPSRAALSDTDSQHRALLAAWTAYITSLCQTPPLATALQRVYAHSKSVPTVLTAFMATFLSLADTPPSAVALAAALPALQPPPSKLALLPSLSDAQLALLVAAARLDVILATDAVNFLLAHDEYARCTARARIVAGAGPAPPLRAWGRDVCLAAWEVLAARGLLVPVLGSDVGAGGGGRLAATAAGAGDAGKRGRLWRVDVSLEEIGRAIHGWGGPIREVERWCRNI